MQKRTREYRPQCHFWRNRVLLPLVLRLVGRPLVRRKGFEQQLYTPRNKTFLLLANHNAEIDPAYEMVCLRQYIRYVASDHVVRNGLKGWAVNYFGTPIVKHRERPSDELIRDIVDTLKAGVCVGLHAEGGTSINGESRHISYNTAKLVQQADCALVTYRICGGYLRAPRWGKRQRTGPLWGGIVREYDREALARMSLDEIYAAICGDLYVNAYQQQRERNGRYAGEALAEHCEIVLYICPQCGQAARLHSCGNFLRCDCGYEVEMQEDGFFHDCGQGLRYDNICNWDHWQKEAIKAFADGFRGRPDEPIFFDAGQIVYRVEGEKRERLSEEATLALYVDRLELRWPDGARSIPLDKIHKLEYVSRQSLSLITETEYFDVGSIAPRSPVKYVDAWRYLIGRSSY